MQCVFMIPERILDNPKSDSQFWGYFRVSQGSLGLKHYLWGVSDPSRDCVINGGTERDAFLARSPRLPQEGRIHSRRPILSSHFSTCKTAADHTFRVGD